MSPSETRTIIHLVDRGDDTVSPLCRDWTHATNWTTVPGVASCPECLTRLAQLREDEERRGARVDRR